MGFASPGPVAISLGPVALRWYGIVLACAAIVGLLLARREAESRGEDIEAILTTCCFALAGGIVGARLYHVAFHLEYFWRSPLKMFAVWEGGAAIYGGILGGVGLAFAYTRWNRLSLGRHLDIMAPGIVLGQAIGRWGNFFNEEAFGRPTDLPWGLYISPARRPAEFVASEHFHPTFLYESLWDFGVFLITFLLLRKPLAPAPGALFLAYLALYSLGRLPIEGLRLDSEMLGPVRSAQVVAAGCLLAAAAGIPWLWSRGRNGGLRRGVGSDPEPIG